MTAPTGPAAALVVALAGLSCSALPSLQTLHGPVARRARAACQDVFAPGAWSVMHTIEISLPLGKKAVLIGVSSGDSARREVRSVLVSPEGLVVFDAEIRDGKVQVHRALPPLDNPGVASGLFRDVHLVLFAPPADTVQIGRSDNGRIVCRFVDKATTDVIRLRDRGYRIVRYAAGGAVDRVVRTHPPFLSAFANRMELVAPGLTGYRIEFKLLRVERAAVSGRQGRDGG